MPYCASKLEEASGGELKCSATGALFSKHIAKRLREGYAPDTRPADAPFPGGISGPWFCPADGEKLCISGEHAICPVCQRHLNEYIYELFQLNPHPAFGEEGGAENAHASAWPYNLPIWRPAHRATSPDGRYVASIDAAYEVSMGNPTAGTFRLSGGLHLPRCNPSFLWSEDSRYVAVPQFFYRFGVIRKQRVVIVAVDERAIFESEETAYYFWPRRFSATELSVIANPGPRPKRLTFSIREI